MDDGRVREQPPSAGPSLARHCPLSLEAFSDRVGLCYQGPLEDVPWKSFLDRIRVDLGARYTTFVLRLPTVEGGGLMINSGEGVTAQATEAYNESYFALDPFVNLPPNTVVTAEEIVGKDAWRRSAFFEEFLKPVGVGNILGADVTTDEGILCRFRVCRGTDQADFTLADRALCQLMLPHLRRSVSLHSQLNTLESERRLYIGTMDRLLIGTVVLDEQGGVLRMNRIAEDILTERDGLKLVGGALTAEYGQEHKDLKRLIGETLGSPPGSGLSVAQALSITRPSGRAKLAVLIRGVPLAEWSEGKRRPAAALFIRDPERRGHASYERIVRQLFDLTPAETAVALLLANGLSLDEVAEQLGIRRNTARAHLRMIFSKTGVSRQTELVRTLLNSVISLS